MAPISNTENYCAAMAGSLEQKLFFAKLVPPLYVMLDYGCADGRLLDEAAQSDALGVNKTTLVNWAIYYDKDDQMLARITPDFYKSIHRDDAAAFAELTEIPGGKDFPRAILFSSVLHEMYTHQPEQMPAFWKRVAATGVEYIIVRDMFWSEQGDPLNFAAAEQIVAPLSAYRDQLNEFVEHNICGLHWGKDLTHFLLKYPYVENWQRELQENYFALPDLRPVLAPLGYEPVHWSHHKVPFIQERIKRDTGLDNVFDTHLTAIFKRK